MDFADMRVYVAKDVPEQRTRDAVKQAGARVTTDLHRPQIPGFP